MKSRDLQKKSKSFQKEKKPSRKRRRELIEKSESLIEKILRRQENINSLRDERSQLNLSDDDSE